MRALTRAVASVDRALDADPRVDPETTVSIKKRLLALRRIAEDLQRGTAPTTPPAQLPAAVSPEVTPDGYAVFV